MTDVTGFGLLGHLTEMAEGSGLSAVIDMKHIPLITADLPFYIEQKSIPGGTHRNWDSYGYKIDSITDYQKAILADPQTSGGLLVAVDENAAAEVVAVLKAHQLENFIQPVGRLTEKKERFVFVQ